MRTRKASQRGFWVAVAGVAAILILLVQLSIRAKHSKWTVPDSIKEKYLGAIGKEATTEETYTVIDVQNDTLLFDDSSMWKGFGSLEKLFIL